MSIVSKVQYKALPIELMNENICILTTVVLPYALKQDNNIFPMPSSNVVVYTNDYLNKVIQYPNKCLPAYICTWKLEKKLYYQNSIRQGKTLIRTF